MESYPDIVMKCPFGDEVKTVTISFDEGGSCAWQVLVDDYYWGVLHKEGGEWYNYLHEDCLFTTQDYQLLVQLIEKHLWKLRRWERLRKAYPRL